MMACIYLCLLLASFLHIGLLASEYKIAIVGSGNWGSAAARRVALNILDSNDAVGNQKYNSTVTMWVYEEEVDGRKLTEIINTDHVNCKYLPGVFLPTNVVACSNIVEACASADLLFFVVPHQFLGGVLRQLKGHVKSSAVGVSLIKGLDVGPNGPILLSQMIQTELGLKQEVAVVMGANVASEVAMDQFVEATVACRDSSVARIVSDLLDSPCFRTSYSSDVITVELCGALKNVIAMGAGFCDALGLGSSTKAAVIRRGLQETMDYCQLVAGDEFKMETLLQSCGLADCVASSYGGRNRKCAAQFALWLLDEQSPERSDELSDGDLESLDSAAGGPGSTATEVEELGQSDFFHSSYPSHEGANDAERVAMLKGVWGGIEKDLLNGQKMQGLITCEELMVCLQAKQLLEERMVEREDRPSETFADYTLRCSEERRERRDGTTITGVRQSVQKTHERRFGLLKRIHAIAHYGDSPTTLFDW